MRFKYALFALLLTFAAPVAAYADTLNLTETTTASGFVNGIAFNDDLLTITATYDTANVFHFGALSVVHVVLQYDIANVGSFTDIGLPDYFVANGVGIGVGSQNHLDLLDSASLAFTGYDLETPFGPLVGTGISPPPGHTHHSGAKADTTAGLFELDSTSPVTITVALAITPPDPDPPLDPPSDPSAVTPEPSSIALLSTGILGIAGIARRRFSRP